MYNQVVNKEQILIDNLFNKFQEVSKFNDLSEIKKSETNNTILKTLMTLIVASPQTRHTINDCVSKKKAGKFAGNKSIAGMISKAKKIVEFVETGGEVETEQGLVDLEYLKTFDADNLPPITATIVYQSVIEFNRAEAQGEKKAELIKEWFLSTHEMLPSGFQKIVPEKYESELAKAEALADEALTVKKPKSLESLKAAIAELSQDDIQAIAEYALSLVVTIEAQAA